MNEEEKRSIKFIKKDLEEEKNLRDDYKWKSGFYENGDIERLLNLIKKQQDEIEDLKKEKRILIEKYTEVVYECGKRNEEIEKLKSRKYILNAETNEIKEIPISDDYISKDKIKEKIEEIISYAYTSAEERDCQDYAIQVLKELIGETNE